MKGLPFVFGAIFDSHDSGYCAMIQVFLLSQRVSDYFGLSMRNTMESIKFRVDNRNVRMFARLDSLTVNYLYTYIRRKVVNS